MKRVALAVSSLLFLAACSSGSSGTSAPSSSRPPSGEGSAETTSSISANPSTTSTGSETPPIAKDGTAIAQDLKTRIGSIQKVETITEDNDPNNLIGRPTGYVSGAVIYDSRAQCSKLGVDCGATVEVWPSAEAAKQRSEYIQGLQKGSPMLGTEYHYLNGAALLRVSGDLKPSAAKEYESAFTGG